ncbi:Protein of uncharacterised function (DUF669) [Aerococcus viridans]|nr:Protein of uncharacterised function (DUF669) [Aerococcus viridans]
MTNWNKFDKDLDLDALQEAVDEAAENGGDFPEIPNGDYEVEVAEMELKETKKGDPMMTIRFKILEGSYKNQLIFFNQVMNPSVDYFGMQVNGANTMLRDLWDADKSDVKFESFAQYAELIETVYKDIDGQFEYLLEKGENKKGYDTYKITDIFEVE